MTQFYEIHAQNPQLRLISQAVASVRNGGLIVYPTDSGYALGCHIGDKKALDRIRKIRKLDKSHNFTLVCRDLSELGIYARVDNTSFRVLKNHTPGPYTFILRASPEVPNRLQHPKRKTIGIRVPDSPIALALLEALGEPLMSTSLILPEETSALADPEEIYEKLKGKVDLVINGGFVSDQPTSVIDMLDGFPKVSRYGAGNPEAFES
ncbi:L-threonylcarbamoyladenylate synthase [Aliikangiella coralliicola]|uniref:Threonylcarbamoyl-AMP synthase n=1 Tax=Aliikangiella coralliicola TaxID=2592383 RepID=A0A545UDD0_9GAMM|nr:L-threonylcarbamoyladenylate synthase [Aliikangiella coralliicola]TQV87471.1 threonylcarbamoyl-AMP synthase [Aliikangiella coralliicola]